MTSTQDQTLYNPQPEHKLLERFAGEWHFEKFALPENHGEPEISGKGKMSAELVGRFFVVCHWMGEIYETEYKALQTIGYDADQNKYTGNWIDSSMNYRWQLDGCVNPESEEFILLSSGPGLSGTTTFRERYQFHSKDQINTIGEMQQDDKWVKFMTTRLSR